MGSERRELVGLLARELAFFDELGNVQRDLYRAPPTLDPRWRDDITNSGVMSAFGTYRTLMPTLIMSALEGKADIPGRRARRPLLTQNGHRAAPPAL